jgi:hypothetical protein
MFIGRQPVTVYSNSPGEFHRRKAQLFDAKLPQPPTNLLVNLRDWILPSHNAAILPAKKKIENHLTRVTEFCNLVANGIVPKA